jgi:hypothetical protein
MPRVPLLQQREPLSTKQKVIGAAVLTGLTAVAFAVTLVVLPIFSYCLLMAYSIGSAVYTKDRWITRAAAASLSLAILSVALSILFPPALAVTIPLMILCTSWAFTYGAGRTFAKLLF